MTRETAQKMLPIIQAYSEGKTIQENVGNGRWVDLPGPDFYRKPENYRIKPREPVIATYDATEGFRHTSFRPPIREGKQYTFIEMTPEVAEAVKHLIPKQILTDETP